jgi:hypothetical protein
VQAGLEALAWSGRAMALPIISYPVFLDTPVVRLSLFLKRRLYAFLEWATFNEEAAPWCSFFVEIGLINQCYQEVKGNALKSIRIDVFSAEPYSNPT